MQFIVLSSSRGTTFEAILHALQEGTLSADFCGLVTDKPDRGCIEKAKAAGVPFAVVERKPEEEQSAYEERLHETILSMLHADPSETLTVIAMIGWMKILGHTFIGKWKNRILNVHPSLLPKYDGLRVHERVLENHETESGMTIHIADEGLDTGKILVQKSCTVNADDTPDTLKQRVQELEKQWYPHVLQQIETGELQLPSQF